MKDDNVRTRALDSGTYIVTTSVNVQPGKADTVALSNYTLSTGTPVSVQYGYDYVLTITSFNRSFLLKDINENDGHYQKVPCKDNDTKCVTNIKSYSVDGLWVESGTLYIRR